MEERKYRPLSDFTHEGRPLEEILETHKKWLETSRRGVGKADLSGALFGVEEEGELEYSGYIETAIAERERYEEAKGVDLSGVNLEGANLSGADLFEANLSKADLGYADLKGVHLSGADLSGAKLVDANLNGVDLSNANLNGANLTYADLSYAKLRNANLKNADLSGADLSRADLSDANISGVAITQGTSVRRTQGIVPGVNGFLVHDHLRHTDSAALTKIIPPGDSMHGHNPQAVIESLKRAQRLHAQSMGLVGIVLLIAVLGLSEGFKFPNTDITITPGQFRLLAMPLSICLLSLVGFFLKDALNGAHYINDRESAMTVGRFPWAISKYSSDNFFDKFQSLISRLIMCFHPLAYLYYYWNKWGTILNDKLFYLCIIPLLLLSVRIFWFSQKFQKPILFDRQTELDRKNDIEKLTDVVAAQSTKLAELVEILNSSSLEKPKQEYSEHVDT